MSRKNNYHPPIFVMTDSPIWVADVKGKLHLSDKTKKKMEQNKKTQKMLLELYKKNG